MRRLLPPQLVLALLVVMAVLTALIDGPRLPGVVRVLGALPLAGGIALTLSGARRFDRVGTNIRTFDDPGELVEHGAFRWTRNPMYLGFVVMLVGAAVLLGSVVVWLGPAAFFLVADRWYVPFEERRMAARFGAAYEDYRSRVPRWISFR